MSGFIPGAYTASTATSSGHDAEVSSGVGSGGTPRGPDDTPPCEGKHEVGPSITPVDFYALVRSQQTGVLEHALLPVAEGATTAVGAPVVTRAHPADPIGTTEQTGRLSSVHASSVPLVYIVQSHDMFDSSIP